MKMTLAMAILASSLAAQACHTTHEEESHSLGVKESGGNSTAPRTTVFRFHQHLDEAFADSSDWKKIQGMITSQAADQTLCYYSVGEYVLATGQDPLAFVSVEFKNNGILSSVAQPLSEQLSNQVDTLYASGRFCGKEERSVVLSTDDSEQLYDALENRSLEKTFAGGTSRILEALNCIAVDGGAVDSCVFVQDFTKITSLPREEAKKINALISKVMTDNADILTGQSLRSISCSMRHLFGPNPTSRVSCSFKAYVEPSHQK